MKFEDLKFEPVLYPIVFKYFPKYLLEQIPDRQWEIEKLYEWAPTFISNPLNAFWVLTLEDNIMKGLLWITIDPVLEMIAVNILSVDSEYQKPRGEAIKKTIEFLKEYRQKLKDEKGIELKGTMLWTTTRPKAFECIDGIKRYNRTIMEVSLI